ncbi:hypothetical protein [Campylobacter sp. RM12651]|uniref:hypothetical protein n=1 Tax=Campylobacter sp. RM12651 TaxID=1660079 RepID=UPI001EFA95ED|nr:hypothetical protein [Campylobacter sp. RM12651]ULO03801.1 hypothetical protein AVBRAN_1347 [Campylobacter sp. RM12651]
MDKDLGGLLAVENQVKAFRDKSTKDRIQKVLCMFYINKIASIKHHIKLKNLPGKNHIEYLANIFSVSYEYMETILSTILKTYNAKTLKSDALRCDCYEDKTILQNISEYEDYIKN